VKEQASGQLFGSGTYLVGDEIESGTYFVEGEIEGCYLERHDSAGEIIDNNFIDGGRRLEVTIRSSDYAFHSGAAGSGGRPAYEATTSGDQANMTVLLPGLRRSCQTQRVDVLGEIHITGPT
jgi:hypothetical protein